MESTVNNFWNIRNPKTKCSCGFHISWNVRVITVIVGFCKLSAFRISANTLIPTNPIIKKNSWASLVAQWKRTCLPTQGTQVRFLVREDSTCLGATKTGCATTVEPEFRAWALQQEKQQQWEAWAPQLEKALAQQRRSSATRNK